MREVGVEARTVALTPLKATLLLAGVVLKPLPWMLTVVPGPPCAGEKLKMEKFPPLAERLMAMILPAAS